ncbi:MAG TPA: ATP-binding protein, partial [Flavisolibacter sp.]|nr:ATP-binding protein [Flavisolibacter sp.]
ETNKKYISKIQESAKRMSGIIEDLLNYSYQGTENKFTNTDLNEIVANVIYDLELLVNQKSALIQYDNLPVIEAVPSQMHQLFYNLINNSLKFSKVSEPPRIFITSRLTENPAGVLGVSLNLSDNGIGFEPEYADKIFQLFKRLNDKHSYSGSGIGLALCKKIVNNHNGSIVAEGELNKGASFDIWLPVKQ